MLGGAFTLTIHQRTLRRELQCLERRPRPGGRTIVDHPRGGHDDHANALALAAVRAHDLSRTFPLVTPILILQENPFRIE